MVEAVVSIVVEQLVSVAAEWLHEEISLQKGVKPKLDNMMRKMLIIQKVLSDAENQSVKNDIVKAWLVKLQNVSYDMDDVLDEWSTRVLMLKREEAQEDNMSNEIIGSSSSSSSSPNACFSLKKLNCFSTIKKLPWHREIALRIKALNERIELVFLEMKDFELASKAVGNDGLNKIINHNDIARTTTSFVDESKVYGRDDDKDFILSKVLSMNTEQEKNLQVISIVGAGGLGKTTLAQMVYNDEEVRKKFGEKIIWVCVSDPFDEVNVARHVLEGLKVDHTKMTSLQALHQSVGESLSRNKFLLVLDDVWNENVEKWDKLCKCLMLGEPESRILVTTRKDEVARIMGTTPSNIVKPQHISDSDCWFLMSQRAFQGRTNTVSEELQDIGKEIAKKCKGLPLAAKTLGGMLISKDSIDEWTKILNSHIWELKQAEVELFPHIFLSYQELPAVLKRCFLILAIFPKDTKIEVERVVGIWMAHGFLNQRTKGDDMVKTGKKYLDFLVSRALLEENNTRISMHDILHDFALHLSGDEFIFIDKIKNDSSSKSTSEIGSCLKWGTARHLYIDGYIDPASVVFDLGKLRTCIIRNVATNVISDFVNMLKMVRALYLDDCDLKHVPPSIKNLIHLRLLDLTDNPLVELPETIGGLYNLQQLFLLHTDFLALPNSMGKLTNLILLELNDRAVEKFPESMGKLIKLQKLGRFYVAAGMNKLGLLKDLNQLRGELKIDFRSDYFDEVDAKKAEIGRKKHITELELDFNRQKVTDGVIAALQPPSNIQVLSLYRLPRSCNQLPSWINSLDHLTDLRLYYGGNVSTLPPLGKLRSLKELYISGFNSLKIIDREFIGLGSKPDKNCSYFPKLARLRIHYCLELTEWEDLKLEDEASIIVVMPNLEILEVQGCDKLDKLPRLLLCQLRQAPSLQNISIINKSFFKFDVGMIPCGVSLRRSGQFLCMIVDDNTWVPKSIIFDSYITLLDLYLEEQPISCLPPMDKLPYLQSIKIHNLRSLKVIGRHFMGIDDPDKDEVFVAFPHLLKLEISSCGLLKEWEDLKYEDEGKVIVMPKLQHLEITDCPNLQVLPSRLLCQGASLEEIRCNNDNDSLAQNIMKDEQLLRHVKGVYVNEQRYCLCENESGSVTLRIIGKGFMQSDSSDYSSDSDS